MTDVVKQLLKATDPVQALITPRNIETKNNLKYWFYGFLQEFRNSYPLMWLILNDSRVSHGKHMVARYVQMKKTQPLVDMSPEAEGSREIVWFLPSSNPPISCHSLWVAKLNWKVRESGEQSIW